MKLINDAATTTSTPVTRLGVHELSPALVYAMVEIEIGGSIKYEVDKNTGLVFVDRFLSTSLVYPCNYGYIPNTMSKDGDPLDVLIYTQNKKINTGCVVIVRPIGVLNTEDEKGEDAKIIAVPITDITLSHIKSYNDLPLSFLKQVEHFFAHYKDLEESKWVRVGQWEDYSKALDIISHGVCDIIKS